MATAASTYASSIGNHVLLQSQWQTKRCDRPKVCSSRCNAAPERERMSQKGGAANSRRSLLAGGVALPFSVLFADNARAFVEEESLTSSERQRRELVQAIQERAAKEEAQAGEAAADARDAAKAFEAAEAEKAAEAEVAAKAKEAAEAQKAADAAEAAAQKTREVEAATKAEAPEVAKPAENVVESVTQKIEEAAESVRSKVEEVVGSSPAKEETKEESKAESKQEAKPDLPAYGPGSARRLREANIRYPTSAEKLPSSPDDVNAGDPVYKRLDSSQNPDLPPLFPKENYGTPWVPPANEPKDKIKMFWGPWDIGPAPEKLITRPFLDTSRRQKDGDEGTGVASVYLGIINLVVLGGYVIAKKAQKGELEKMLDWSPSDEKKEGATAEGDTDKEGEKSVQQMRAEKEAFDAAEAERVARGESSKGSETVKEDKH